MKHVEFSIPAIRGTQAGHAIYSAMCPIRLLPRLFPVGVDQVTSDTAPALRRVNKARARDIAKQIVGHRDNYQLQSVTISIEREVRFVTAEPVRSKQPAVGELFIPLDARLTILDGLHRIAGLQRAISESPSLGDDSIAMLLHVDPKGSRRSQLFSDVKRRELATALSQRIAFDERDEVARLTRDVITAVSVFGNAIEMEKTAISNRSRKLFTLSALYHANRVLLADRKHDPYKQRVQFATEFWAAVAEQIPGWSEIVQGKTSPADIRAAFVHCHAIGISAIARAGRALVAQFPKDWKKRLAKLSSLDWSRSNKKLWEGRAMIGGRLSKSSSAVARAGIAVKRHLGLTLSREELEMEK